MYSFLSRLPKPLQSILRPILMGTTPRKQQEQIDLYRAAVLLKGHAWHHAVRHTRDTANNSIQLLSQDDVDGFYREVDQLTTKEIAASVHKSLETQIITMLRDVDTYSSTIEKAIAGAGSSSLANRGGDVGNTAKSTMFDAIGFKLEVRDSTIPDAGLGVFLKGQACPGTVISFHPGTVHLAEYASRPEYMKDLLPDDDFMMIVRNDGHIIDARGAHLAPFNPFALGHKINHVPAGKTPNCLQIAFNYPDDPLGLESFPQDLRRYIPNVYSRPPTMFGTSDRSACMRGIVYLAACPLGEDEELFVDYRLNPFAGALPSWYVPYDNAGAQRRWHDDNNTTTTTTSNSNSKNDSTNTVNSTDTKHTQGDDESKEEREEDDLLFRKQPKSPSQR